MDMFTGRTATIIEGALWMWGVRLKVDGVGSG